MIQWKNEREQLLIDATDWLKRGSLLNSINNLKDLEWIEKIQNGQQLCRSKMERDKNIFAKGFWINSNDKFVDWVLTNEWIV